MNHLLQFESREEAINAEGLEEQRRAPKAQQASHPFRRELRLRQPQYFIAPAAQMLGIFHKAAWCIRCTPGRVRDGAAGRLAIRRSSRAVPECATPRRRDETRRKAHAAPLL